MRSGGGKGKRGIESDEKDDVDQSLKLNGTAWGRNGVYKTVGRKKESLGAAPLRSGRQRG